VREDHDDRAGTLERAVDAGRELAAEAFRSDVAVETKAGPLDTVTEVDRAVQRRVIEEIRASYPDATVVGEEGSGPARLPESGPAWVVDPIDGTNNYVVGDRTWAVSVAAVVDGEPVAAANAFPALGDAYAAGEAARRNGDRVTVSAREDPAMFTVAPIFGLSRIHRRELADVCGLIAESFGDLRRIGSAQCTLSKVADGQLDAAVSTVPFDPWDTVAGVRLVRAAGGTVTDPEGSRWRHDAAGLIASNGRAHDRLVEAVGGV